MLFVTFEGLDGSGKTTIAKMVKQRLLDKGYHVLLTREPGGVPIAEAIREIILDHNNKNMDPWTEALLYIAARKQHVEEKIMPLLKKGTIILCDRFMDSTSAYQGHARGIGARQLDEIQTTVLGLAKPDLTLFFDIEPEKALERIKQRTAEDLNRFDVEKISFHQKVYEGYQVLISENPQRIKVVNARQEIKCVFDDSLRIIMEYLESKS